MLFAVALFKGVDDCLDERGIVVDGGCKFAGGDMGVQGVGQPGGDGFSFTDASDFVDECMAHFVGVAAQGQLHVYPVGDDVVFCPSVDGPHSDDGRIDGSNFAADDGLQVHDNLG